MDQIIHCHSFEKHLLVNSSRMKCPRQTCESDSRLRHPTVTWILQSQSPKWNASSHPCLSLTAYFLHPNHLSHVGKQYHHYPDVGATDLWERPDHLPT